MNPIDSKYWTALQEAFPEQMKQLDAWIEEYTNSKSWGIFIPGIKFRHLPMEMQTGIVFMFFQQVWEVENVLYPNTLQLLQMIKDVFAEKFLEDQLAELQKDE